MDGTMVEARKQIGEIFRAKREEMHLSLKEVENATSIRMIFLQAIEEGNADKFLSPIYSVGFVKQYAAFLGFDGARIIEDNKEAFEVANEKPEFAYGIGTLDVRGAPAHHNTRMFPKLWKIGAVALVLFLAWAFGKLINVF